LTKLEGTVRNAARRFLLARERVTDPRLRPWPSARRASMGASLQHVCNICGWHGSEFAAPPHSEAANCPHCGSIARDRFLYWCWTHRVPYDRNQRVLETSPRLDERYRERIARVVNYTASDYDESAHKAMIKLDLQHIELPDASVDVVLTPHVLEHVPNTESALSELYRVVSAGGSVMLMIPMPQGITAPPVEPEYHGDNTLVFWRFGWDLREKIETAGFTATCLTPQPLIDRLLRKEFDTGWSGADIDEVDLLSHADPASLTPIASERDARRYGFIPDLHFIVWHCAKPAS
jgi:SAM-dependent methyltransferase